MKSNVKSERLDNANCQLHGGNQILAEKDNVRFDIQNFMWQQGGVGGRGSEGGLAMGEVMWIIEKVWATCAANHSFAQEKDSNKC